MSKRKSERMESFLFALGVALFTGFWIGSALFIIFAAIVVTLPQGAQSAVVQVFAKSPLKSGEVILILDAIICLIVFLLIRKDKIITPQAPE